VNNFESLCVNGEDCVAVVFSILQHSAECVLSFEKRVHEICKQRFNHLNLFNVLQKE